MSHSPTATELAGMIDVHLHRGDATARDVEELCAQAVAHKFHAVCVNGCWVALARHHLEETEVKVAATIGFPLGAMDADVKRYETEAAIDVMAQEIDAVVNIGRLKEGDTRFVLRELRDIVEAADERPVNVIIESHLLTREEKLRACDLIVEAGAKCVQTSTGLATAGAIVADVALLREAVGGKFGVKAAGELRDVQTARALVEAGATRLGTSSGTALTESLISARADSN
jgi:deoxyribose-phosphate aldolase